MKKIIALMFMLAELTITKGAKANTIVNSLGQITPNTQFSVFGSGGLAISRYQLVGPEFVLTQPTILTEVGGFVNNCDQIISGEPICPGTLPFTVQIRPSLNGVPDLSNIIRSFVLSHDNDPLTISYEFVAPDLLLEPGVYFALFAPQDFDGGFLLESISNPPYSGERISIGAINFYNDPTTVSVEQRTSVVRILGTPSAEPASVPEPSSAFALISMSLIGLLSYNRCRPKPL
jgi:hypothetical protein